MVAEIDEVLVRHRHEALVEDGQPSDAGVEHAYWTWIHCEHRNWATSVRPVGRVRVARRNPRRSARVRRGRFGRVRLGRGHDQRLGRDAARVRVHHPDRHRSGRRLARRHPLPRSRAVPHGHGAVRQRVGAIRVRRARLRRPRDRRLRRQVRARRAERGAGRAGLVQLVRGAERRLGHRDRGLRSLARRRRGLERSRCRRSVQGDRPGSRVDGSRRGAQPERRAEGRRDQRARRCRSVLPVGPLTRAGVARSGRLRRERRGQERRGGPFLASEASLAHRSDAVAAGTARLPVRHGSGRRRLQAARGAEAAVPRRHRPCTGEEPVGRSAHLPHRGGRLVQPISRRRAEARRRRRRART